MHKLGVLFILILLSSYAMNLLVAHKPKPVTLREEVRYPETMPDEINIKWKVFESKEEIIEACRVDMGLTVAEAAASRGVYIAGCSRLLKKTSTCLIYARKPKYVKKDFLMGVLGHEMLHCFAGKFHGQGPVVRAPITNTQAK